MSVYAYSPPRDPLAKINRRLTQWNAARPADLRFEQPVLSISFDDFPASAAEIGAAILENHGALGTFYAACGLVDSDGPCGRNFSHAHLADLVARGHEIGCHTYDHADCARRPVFDTLQDLARNRDTLQRMGAREAARTLAYPYGETSTALKRALPPRLQCARGVLQGINVGRCDLSQLRAFPMFGGGLEAMRAALKRAAKRRAWVIGFTHDIADAPSAWGTRGADLDGMLRAARELGFTVLPVSAALARRAA